MSVINLRAVTLAKGMQCIFRPKAGGRSQALKEG